MITDGNRHIHRTTIHVGPIREEERKRQRGGRRGGRVKEGASGKKEREGAEEVRQGCVIAL